jgi:hypothetical protein
MRVLRNCFHHIFPKQIGKLSLTLDQKYPLILQWNETMIMVKTVGACDGIHSVVYQRVDARVFGGGAHRALGGERRVESALQLIGKQATVQASQDLGRDLLVGWWARVGQYDEVTLEL